MFNYSMKYGVSETARLLTVDRETVQTWARIFSDYLSPEANKEKKKTCCMSDKTKEEAK